MMRTLHEVGRLPAFGMPLGSRLPVGLARHGGICLSVAKALRPTG